MKKIVIIASAIIISVCLYFIIIMRNEKQEDTGPNYTEIYRIISPDSLYDAVYQAESLGGALGSVVFQAYVVPRGKNPLTSTCFIEAVHIDSVRISWVNNNELCFTFKGGRVLIFKNQVSLKNGTKGTKQFIIKQISN